MPIYDQHSPGGRVGQASPAPGLKNLGKPLVAVAITCLATLASSETPVGRYMFWDPSRRQILGLEYEERWTYNPGSIYYFNRRYPFLPTLYLLPARSVAYID
jgi:hypothetical protein